MNIFTEFRDYIIDSFDIDTSKVVVELPRDESHGDLASNAALVLSKQLGMNPRELANIIKDKLIVRDDVKDVSIDGPGFINIHLYDGIWANQLSDIISEGSNYGRNDIGKNASVNIEFVSANPSGPLHVAHARGAVLGDVLANLLSWSNYNVTREYYINDRGNQIEILAKSAYIRYRQACGENIKFPSGDFYQGGYLKDVGSALKEKYGNNLTDLSIIEEFTIDAMMTMIKADLEKFGVKMDIFTSEKNLINDETMNELIEKLGDHVYKGYLDKPKSHSDDWEEREQLLFRSSDFGDDVDRPLQKSDGDWTYFATDIAYHMDKLKRSDSMINIWGADHDGYVKRMKGAVKALSGDKLDIKLYQIVNLSDNGYQVKMSKRGGNFISLNEFIDEVNSDALRFTMMTLSHNQIMDFDYAKVTEKTRNNPVYYVQYAYARSCSVLNINIPSEDADLSLLNNPLELKLIKHLVSWPNLVKNATITQEPHKIAFYLIELAALFHSLWNSDVLFIDEDIDITKARLNLVKANSIVLENGLNLLGVSAPNKM